MLWLLRLLLISCICTLLCVRYSEEAALGAAAAISEEPDLRDICLHTEDANSMNVHQLESCIHLLHADQTTMRKSFLEEGVKPNADLKQFAFYHQQLGILDRQIKTFSDTLLLSSDMDYDLYNDRTWNTLFWLIQLENKKLWAARDEYLKEGSRMPEKDNAKLERLQEQIAEHQKEADRLEKLMVNQQNFVIHRVKKYNS